MYVITKKSFMLKHVLLVTLYLSLDLFYRLEAILSLLSFFYNNSCQNKANAMYIPHNKLTAHN